MRNKFACKLLQLALNNAFDEASKDGEDGGYIIFMIEENCEKYNDVRMICTGESKYSKYQNEQIMLDFMREYKITKEQATTQIKEK